MQYLSGLFYFMKKNLRSADDLNSNKRLTEDSIRVLLINNIQSTPQDRPVFGQINTPQKQLSQNPANDRISVKITI